MGLYTEFFQRIQEVNEYGGGFATFQFRETVFNAIDDGANAGDQTLCSLRKDLLVRAEKWKNVEDHEARSRVFDTYCEATFYLSSAKYIALKGVPRNSGNTPDFQTQNEPLVQFELKTLDIAEPPLNYAAQMDDGLEGIVQAIEEAQNKGIGFGETILNPHGKAKTWSEVIEQTMKKLSGNIKKGQYTDAPTFLVANLGRLSVMVDTEQLNHTYIVSASETFEGVQVNVSGQLWTIANHTPDGAFSWLDADNCSCSAIIQQAGLLKDHPFLQGIIFTTEPWSDFEQQSDWRDAYRFLGIWNRNCSEHFGIEQTKAARKSIDAICERVVDAL